MFKSRIKRGITSTLFLRIIFVVIGLLPCPLYAASKEQAIKLNQQGMEAYKYGRYNEALSYFEDSLKMNREIKNPQGIATSLNNIGGIYQFLGQYDKALGYYEESLKMYRGLKIPQNIATSLNNIGYVYASLGQYDKALGYYEESLKMYRELKIPQNIANSLNNIGAVYDSLGQYDKALGYHEESLKISRGLKIPQGIANSLNNIGAVYLSKKMYKEAEEKFYEIKKETGWRGSSLLAEVYIATNRYKEAVDIIKDKTPKWNSSNPSRVYYNTVYGLALKGANKTKDASAEFLKAVSISEEMRQKVKAQERVGFFTGGYVGGRIRAYKGLVASLSERAINGEGKEEAFAAYGRDIASNAFYFSESTKAMTLLEAIAESAKRYEKSELPSDIRKKEEDLLNQLSAIEKQWDDAYKKGDEALKTLIKRKEGLKKELDELILKIRKEHPRYAALNYPSSIKPEDIPLRKNEVLLEYAVSDDAVYLFIIKDRAVKRLIKITEGREGLEALVNKFIIPLQSQYTKEDFSPVLGNKLYALLLEDALKDITPDTNIIIVPDGILGLLPFEALVTKAGKGYKDSQYVGDKYNITYSQSATVLTMNRMLKPSQARKSIFALGNPIYDKGDPRYIAFKKGGSQPVLIAQNKDKYSYRGLATRREWGKTGRDDKEGREIIFEPLLETEEEVKAIARLFGIKPNPPDILLNIFANESNLRRQPLNNYKYIHFATHADLPGKVQGINEPFILLGQVENEAKDDGILTLTEVLGLRLDSDMVVLSACLTGRGKMTEGEGVMNFARAFHHAGSRSVVVSLWEVASNETVEYMKLFYQHLKAGRTRAEALSLTRKEIKAKYPNPFFWAPFILHGEG